MYAPPHRLGVRTGGRGVRGTVFVPQEQSLNGESSYASDLEPDWQQTFRGAPECFYTIPATISFSATPKNGENWPVCSLYAEI